MAREINIKIKITGWARYLEYLQLLEGRILLLAVYEAQKEIRKN
jgi:hypothetical protein